jgi:hypothetical protein
MTPPHRTGATSTRSKSEADLVRRTSPLDVRCPFNMFLKHYFDIGTERTSILLSELFQLGF